MPTPFFIILLSASLALAPAAGIANRPFCKKEHYAYGLIIPTLLALTCYATFALLWIYDGIGSALLGLVITNIPLLASLIVYCVLRLQRNRALTSEYRARRRASRPPIAASAKMHALIKGFHFETVLTKENLSEVIILLKSGTPHEKIATTYDCTAYEIKRIEKAFDRYAAQKDEQKDGETYTVSPEQGEFFLQLMINATPKSLDCGDRLLWTGKGVARLIKKATKIEPSRKSVANFLSENGLLPREEDLAVTKTAQAKQWIEGEYRKIRMSALEKDAVIYWVYAPTSATPRKRLVLCATASDGSAFFGVYKGSGGFADFLNKLAQETHAHVYAVICTKYKDYKNLNSLSSDITLFSLGETAHIPE